MSITEKRIMHSSDVRKLCIKENWYTKGCNDDYRIMLQSCNSDFVSLGAILITAKDIYYNSDIDLSISGLDKNGYIEHICFCLINYCTQTVVTITD